MVAGAADPDRVNPRSGLTPTARDIASAEPAAGHGPANPREPAETSPQNRAIAIGLAGSAPNWASGTGSRALAASALDPLTVPAALFAPLPLSGRLR